MAAKTEAQEEFDNLVLKASSSAKVTSHFDDIEDYKNDKDPEEQNEESAFLQKQVDENMRMPSLDPRGGPMFLPHRDFDNGRTTGVKGVIADARSFEEARRSQTKDGWRGKVARASSATRIGNGNEENKRASTFLRDDGDGSASEEEEFVERWREQRREELRKEGNDIRNRRTSPSVRRYGRFDEVDALGYLDAIEKVTRETVVVVFVYDPEVCFSLLISHSWSPSSKSFIRYSTYTNNLPVSSLPSHLRRTYPPSTTKPRHPLRPRPLRRHRVRQRRRTRYPRI